MTPCQKIQRDIVLLAYTALKDESGLNTVEQAFVQAAKAQVLTEQNVTKMYYLLQEFDGQCDIESDFRRGQVETGLPCESSRYYSSRSVAAKLSDGTWVGWIYWFGGGKHGEPGSINWMEHAYDLEVREGLQTVLVRQFERADGQVSKKAVLL